MVDYSTAADHQLDLVFGALADGKRRGMLARLIEGPASIGELGEPYAISKQAVTRHVRVLEDAGLIRREVDGRVHRCHLERPRVTDARGWLTNLERYWEAQLDSLEAYLASEEPARGPAPNTEPPTTGTPSTEKPSTERPSTEAQTTTHHRHH